MRGKQTLAFAGVIVLAGTVVLDEAVFPTGLDTVTLAMLVGIGSACLAGSIWQGSSGGNRRFVPLGTVFCLYYSVSYGFAVLGAPPPTTLRVLPLGLDSVDLAALPVGILFWFLGYRLVHVEALTKGARNLVFPRRTLRPVGASTLLFFYATTVLVRVYQVVSGSGFGYLQDVGDATTSANSGSQYLSLYGEFGIIVLGVAAVASGHATTHREQYLRAVYWIVPFELLFRVVAGNKSGILLLVLVLAMSLAAAGRLRLTPRTLIVTGLVAILVIFPFIGTYRDILRPSAGQQLAPIEAPAAAIAAAKSTASAAAGGPGEYTRFAFDQTAGRLREIDRAAVSVQAHDAGKPYSSPDEMAQRVATSLVPRLLWPGKPLNLYALEVARDYYGVSNNVINASSLSPVGDAYRYGGLVAVAIGLTLLGAFVRFLEEMLSPQHSIWLLPLFIAAIPFLRGGDLAGLLVGTIRYFVVVGALYRLLFVRAVLGGGSAREGAYLARSAAHREPQV